jgi:hypothetical protein
MPSRRRLLLHQHHPPHPQAPISQSHHLVRVRRLLVVVVVVMRHHQHLDVQALMLQLLDERLHHYRNRHEQWAACLIHYSLLATLITITISSIPSFHDALTYTLYRYVSISSLLSFQLVYPNDCSSHHPSVFVARCQDFPQKSPNIIIIIGFSKAARCAHHLLSFDSIIIISLQMSAS